MTLSFFIRSGNRVNIGYLGPVGTFSYQVAHRAFPEEQHTAYTTISECLDAVAANEIDICLVPFENAIEGTVNVTLDYLYQNDVPPIQAEYILPISQNIMVNKQRSSDWQEATTILSHPQGLAQCHDYLTKNFPHIKREAVSSTAFAAEYVSTHPDEKTLAIAPLFAAEHYDLDVVRANAQGNMHNETRFIALSNRKLAITDDPIETKTTLLLKLPDNDSGTLHTMLSTFAWRNINMSKIESRPTKTRLGQYFFHIDLDVGADNRLLDNAMVEISLLGGTVKVLGSYDVYKIK
nr:prephenate dehydratase [Brochothrix thermosphacta]